MILTYIRYTYLLEYIFFFFNDTATTEIYTLSLHDALPILYRVKLEGDHAGHIVQAHVADRIDRNFVRSEEHTSELQSRSDLVCRLLLEKKKNRQLAHLTTRLQHADVILL